MVTIELREDLRSSRRCSTSTTRSAKSAADASKFTDDSYKFAFDLLEKAYVGAAPGVD